MVLLFNTTEFFIFFAIVFAGNLMLGQQAKIRTIFLLVASYYFYTQWKLEYVFLIIISTLVDYFIGQKIYKAALLRIKKRWLLVSLFCNLGMLAIFKYFSYFSGLIRGLFSKVGVFFGSADEIDLGLLLPVGISFYTFQSMSYSIDIYLKKIQPEKSFFKFALFVSFFPQLLAGPIERSSNLLPQFNRLNRFDYQMFVSGARLILFGLFKKVVIADNLAVIVNFYYSNPSQHDGFLLMLATIAFAFQIYCDFSGYTDIATGVARCLGIDLMDNFNRPYYAESFASFWKRWHISLSTWFRDYVYIPLGGNQSNKYRHYLNLLVTFFIGGLWHGAANHFIVWGVINGFYLIIENHTKNFRKIIFDAVGITKFPRIYSSFCRIFVFFFTCLSWVFFRAETTPEALLIIKKIFLVDQWSVNYSLFFEGTKFNQEYLFAVILAIGLLEFVHLTTPADSMKKIFDYKWTISRWSIYCIIIFFFLAIGNYQRTEFIYFQF